MNKGHLAFIRIREGLIVSETGIESEDLLEGLREELEEYGAEDLIVFGLKYTDDDEIDMSIWDSLGDPELVADLLEDYVKAYREETKTKKK
ncbi:hypothetical protein O4H49_07775 [Kiloniella laminariae]|uniref:Uncharacterized protein n=1 Tax=Kiloniella laminariae TaxID=454162 RepID=A0ABT4LHV4_9PROT|nr:hypothetical protein [Kiloniella laminariae]MCZ4280673.1 hypothetical protein [Kiloniella laminariae]